MREKIKEEKNMQKGGRKERWDWEQRCEMRKKDKSGE